MTASDGPPVLVVGLGPVGATVALLLARQGIRVVAVERERALFPHARAVALDDEALRVLQAAGVGADTGLALLSGSTVRLRGRSGAPLVDLPPVPVDTGHPSLPFFRQPDLERLLRAGLAAQPLVDVRLGQEVVAVRQDGAVVHATVRAAGSSPGAVAPQTELAGACLIACDGGRSTVRRLLGVRLAGRSAGADWLVVDTTAPDAAAGSPFAAADFEFACDPRRPWVHGPLPGGAHRWEFMLGPGESAAGPTRPAVVAALLRERLGGDGAAAPAVLRAAVYTFHARVATRWRHGRILLAGDAAHLAPPFAGQGLGAGLRDAHNLAWKVAAVVQGQAADTLLDSYARERLPHVARMTALATAMGAVVQTRRPRPAALRDHALLTLIRCRRVQAWVARGGWKPSSRIGRGGLLAPGPHRHRAGAVLPQPRRPDASGERAPGDERLGDGFALLGVGVDPAATLGPAGRAAVDALGVRLLTVEPTDTAGAALAAWLAPARIALVRPDRVVFGTARTVDDTDHLLAALTAALGV